MANDNGFSDELLDKEFDDKLSGGRRKLRDILRDIIKKASDIETNVLIVGGTGVGKSSTINALFKELKEDVDEEAKIGTSAKPQTMDVKCYKLGNFTIWDSPGLGDSEENDKMHAEKIESLLKETRKSTDLNSIIFKAFGFNSGTALIDMVLVIVDASSRDLGTTYKLIKEVIIPNLDEKERILIAMNKCDLRSPRYFDYEKNQPKEELIEQLDDDVKEIKNRIKEDTGVDVEVMYYAAGETDLKENKQPPYNLEKLFYYIVKSTPKKKRLVYAKYRNENEANFRSNDGRADYKEETEKSWWETIKEYVEDGIELVGGFLKSETGQKIVDFGKTIRKTILNWFSKK